jgi:DnaK suppressor protein
VRPLRRRDEKIGNKVKKQKQKSVRAKGKTKTPAKKTSAVPKPKADSVKRSAAARKVDHTEERPVEPKKLKLSKEDAAKYRQLLLQLRDHLIDGVNFLATDNLKRSTREASGELSGYGLHMADAGTDNFDREFALSLVSSEQEALYEIEEAIKRLEHGTYGLCEMCEKPIRKERLEAVPFARFCVACQSNFEKDRRRPAQPTGVFSESGDEEEGEEAEE